MTTDALVLAAEQQPGDEFDFYTVSPGLPGFITFFVLAVAGWLLFRSMARHLRKVQRRAATQRRAQDGATDPASPDEADRPAERP